ncbi:MAG: N-acetyl sugar amidotransferase [Bacteroidia bacterium]
MSTYQMCTRCVWENSPRANLTFDTEGVCNNCRSYEKYVKDWNYGNEELNRKRLEEIISAIKKSGEGKEYDCILGISGGVDSTYLALLAKQQGLRPLVVHFDNGWNSELSVRNIHHIVETLKFDLHTYVIDWDEFRDLQVAYIRASVIDIEVPTDQFIYATLYEVAYKNKIKYILDGNNYATEYAGCTAKWGSAKTDLVSLENIHNRFGKLKLTKFPKLGFYQRYYYNEIKGIQSVYPLNFVPYHKKEVVKVIEKELGWKEPGGKHYESIFTRFYQGYILPRKFGVDKRIAHFSNLIWSGQMSRQEALEKLKEATYPVELQEEDKRFVCKKLGFSPEEFEEIMKQPLVEHAFYGGESDYALKHYYFKRIADPLARIAKKLRIL